MSLSLITLLNGVALIALGAGLLSSHPRLVSALQGFPRSQPATWVLLGVATAWFLYHVQQLGEADYGNYKNHLSLGFVLLAALSLYFSPDFLSVRAGCVLILLIANQNLSAAYMQWEHPQRLVLVTFSYGIVILALYLAISPFRLRDALNWLFERRVRTLLWGAGLSIFGLLLAGISFTY